MHLAQLNIAHLLHPIDDPRIADFVANLDRINAAAERSPGFAWRFQTESGNATDAPSPWGADTIVNMSVWTDPTSLENYVWRTVHARIYERRAEWFSTMRSHHLVMWWVPAGHRPTLPEAEVRLARLDAEGDTDEAFGWARLPHVKLWQTRRCA